MKKSIFLVFLLFFSFALVACTQAGDKSELTLVRLNEVVRSVFYAPLYAAIELGFFEEEGLEIELQTGNGADRSMIALISGSADIGLMGTEAAIYVYNEGRQDHAKIFAQLTQRAGNFLVSREYIPYFTWNDVKGKTIIGGRPGGMPQMVLEYVLYLHGIVPSQDVDIITNLAFTTTAGAFVGGIGDFTAEFDPAALEIENAGVGYVVTGLANYTDILPYTVFMANISFIQNNIEVIQGFSDAIARGKAWVNNSSIENIAYTISGFFPHNSLEDLVLITQRYKNQDTWGSTTKISPDGFYLLQEIMLHGGEISEVIDFDTLIDDSFFN